MSNEKLVELGIGLLLAAYALIFRIYDKRIEGQDKRLKDLEDVDCDPVMCAKRFEKIEEKQEKVDPVFLEIKERLVRIEVILEELKKK